jgi:hypothetical protein
MGPVRYGPLTLPSPVCGHKLVHYQFLAGPVPVRYWLGTQVNIYLIFYSLRFTIKYVSLFFCYSFIHFCMCLQVLRVTLSNPMEWAKIGLAWQPPSPQSRNGNGGNSFRLVIHWVHLQFY